MAYSAIPRPGLPTPRGQLSEEKIWSTMRPSVSLGSQDLCWALPPGTLWSAAGPHGAAGRAASRVLNGRHQKAWGSADPQDIPTVQSYWAKLKAQASASSRLGAPLLGKASLLQVSLLVSTSPRPGKLEPPLPTPPPSTIFMEKPTPPHPYRQSLPTQDTGVALTP